MTLENFRLRRLWTTVAMHNPADHEKTELELIYKDGAGDHIYIYAYIYTNILYIIKAPYSNIFMYKLVYWSSFFIGALIALRRRGWKRKFPGPTSGTSSARSCMGAISRISGTGSFVGEWVVSTFDLQTLAHCTVPCIGINRVEITRGSDWFQKVTLTSTA